jgi:hypothetical protein
VAKLCRYRTFGSLLSGAGEEPAWSAFKYGGDGCAYASRIAGPLDWRAEVLPALEAAYGQLGTPEGFADAGEVDTDALNRALGRDRNDARTALVLRHLQAGGGQGCRSGVAGALGWS